MPRVKIDYIVSFSSEDPENQASNLLAWDVNKKKWLCNKGEPSCSVVLQLAKAVKICAVHVGAYHSALVEVLVGRSETPNEPFQVLVPSSVFESPSEARKDEAADRVRSFAADNLAAAVAEQRWDRVRVVCSQPYNKHCKYGLSFVHIYCPESEDPTRAPSQAPPVTSLATYSSDEDEFRPGELFAKHLQKPKDAPVADTGAQIRQATSQALKNIPDFSIKLTKTPITTKASKRGSSRADDEPASDRHRDSLLYSADDKRPHDKIDRVLTRHHDDKARDEAKTNKHRDKRKDGQKDDKQKKHLTSRDEPSSSKTDTPSNKEDKDEGTRAGQNGQSSRKKDSDNLSSNRRKGDEDSRKRTHSDKKRDNEREPGPVSSAPHTLLSDVVFVLSGYENPRRANVRSAALALGARCERDWGPRCTHLICAFPNTPKLRAVRAGPGGARAAAVRAEWVEATARLRRRLPAEWFAAEPARRVPPPRAWEGLLADAECDTDDEIERVRQKVKKPRTDRSPRVGSPPRSPRADTPPHSPRADPPPRSPRADPPHRSPRAECSSPADVSANSDVTFVRDERIQGSITMVESDSEATDEEPPSDAREQIDPAACLPNMFAGLTFAVSAAGEDATTIARYLAAYGGLVTHEEDAAQYVVCGEGSSARGERCVSAGWLWRCHRERRLCVAGRYRRT